MRTRKIQWLKRPPDKSRLPNRFVAVLLFVAMLALGVMDFGLKTFDTAYAGSSGLMAASEQKLSDIRLSPGDRLKIVVYDQPQLSGEFVIDGGGGLLLPLAGNVDVSGLTLTEAQKAIQDRFADGVLVQPAVSLSITEYKPIFVTGDVRKPGSYKFILGGSAKAAIATAGGEGSPLEQLENAAVSDFIAAEERVHQLEEERVTLLVRKARLEAQRDGRETFISPIPVGLDLRHADYELAYSNENDTFSRLEDAYHDQVQALQAQRPRIEAEIKAVVDQIARQKERLEIVNGHLADLQSLFNKGLLRKDVLLNQQIEKSLVEAQASNLEAQVARLRQVMGELDVKLKDAEANYERQTLAELQQVAERLRTIENSVGPARRILAVKANAASGNFGQERGYRVLISRIDDGRTVTFEAADETMLLPGDVVEVKLNERAAQERDGTSTQAMHSSEMGPTTVAEESHSLR